jgi:hypothetical protein
MGELVGFLIELLIGQSLILKNHGYPVGGLLYLPLDKLME